MIELPPARHRTVLFIDGTWSARTNPEFVERAERLLESLNRCGGSDDYFGGDTMKADIYSLTDTIHDPLFWQSSPAMDHGVDITAAFEAARVAGYQQVLFSVEPTGTPFTDSISETVVSDL